MILAALALGASYGEHLARATLARHREVASIAIKVPGSPPIAAGAQVGVAATAALANATGEPIGTISVTCRIHRCAAMPIAAELARHVYVVGNLAEPDPFITNARPSPFAERLVERSLTAFPDLVTLAFHVAPPGRANIIIASSFGRIGKPGDADDARIIASGRPVREVTNGGRRLAVETQLLDKAGRTIGALSMSFRLGGAVDTAAAYARAITIRDALARRIPSLAVLATGAR